MSRRRGRASRALVIVLAFVLVVGLSVYYLRNTQSEPSPETVADAAGGTPASVPVTETPSVSQPTPTSPTIATTVTPTRVPAAPASEPVGTRASTDAATDATPAADASAPAAPAAPRRPVSPNVLSEAAAALDADRVLEARTLLNDALLSGSLSAADAHEAKTLISQASQTLLFSKPFVAGDTTVERYTIQAGDSLTRIANKVFVPWQLIATINGISNPQRIRAGQVIKLPKGPLHAVVDKSDFTLDLYFNSPGGPDSVYITTVRVGLGADDSTPTGAWLVQPGSKLTDPVYYSPRGEGVIAAGDPTNPLGRYWIGLQGTGGNAVGKESYGIHGTIEPETIGTQASLGCIRLLDDDIKLVYESLYEGKSQVVVQD